MNLEFSSLIYGVKNFSLVCYWPSFWWPWSNNGWWHHLSVFLFASVVCCDKLWYKVFYSKLLPKNINHAAPYVFSIHCLLGSTHLLDVIALCSTQLYHKHSQGLKMVQNLSFSIPKTVGIARYLFVHPMFSYSNTTL